MPTRIARGSGPTLRAELEDADGEPLDEAVAVTVAAVDSEGAEVATGNATAVSGEDGVFSFALSAAATAEVDLLTLAWSWSGGQAVTEAAVVGCHYFALRDLRRLEPLDDAVKYPTPLLARYRDLASDALEEACRVAFCERFATHVAVSDGISCVLPRVGVRRILWATAAGGAVDVDDLTLDGPVLVGLGTKDQRIEVGFVHALTGFPPLRVRRAAQLLAREVAFADEDSAIPDRATSENTEMGTFSLVTAGLGDAAFNLPEVNAVVKRYRQGLGPIAS